MDLVTIYSAANSQQAQLLKIILEKQGIKSFVEGDVIHDNVGVFGVGPGDRVTVAVTDQDVPAARKIAELFDAEVVRHALEEGVAVSTQVEEIVEAMLVDQWPKCPGCGRMRSTMCPVCETSGSDFAAADMVFGGELTEEDAPVQEQGSCCSCGHGGCQTEKEKSKTPAPPADSSETESDEKERYLMLVCPTCDEPFKPQFPNRCEWCGHQFPDGFEPKENIVNLSSGAHNVRVVVAIVALGLLGLGLMAFFAWVVH